MKIKYCSKCLFPETKPDLFFNEAGVCSACQASDQKNKNIDWELRKHDFESIINHFKKKGNERGYDCLIPVSGG